MSRNSNTNDSCVLALISIPLLILFAVVANAFALMILWNWFVPSFIESMPVMTLQVAAGLSLLISFLVPGQTQDDSSLSGKGMAELIGIGIAKIIARPAAAVFLGWIVYSLL